MKRFTTALALSAMLATLAAIAPAAAAAAAPAATWQITAISYPTAFEAGSANTSIGLSGPAIKVEAFNVGGTATSGEFKITDILPGPLRPAPGFPPVGTYGPPALREFMPRLSCTALGHTITCSGGGGGKTVGPGEAAVVIVPVEVEPSAAGELVDKAQIEGGGAATAASTTTPVEISASPSPFGFISGPAGLLGFATNADGSATTQAGSHPYQDTVAAMSLAMNAGPTTKLDAPGGGLREVVAELPRGLVVNPNATPKCRESEFEDESVTRSEGRDVLHGCPETTQVGVVFVNVSVVNGLGGEAISAWPLYNLVPPPGYPAELGFQFVGSIYVHLLGSVRSDGTFTLSASGKNILAYDAVGGARPVLWGEPSAESHDDQRYCLAGKTTGTTSLCPVERTGKAFVTMPSACTGPLMTSVKIASWDEPNVFDEEHYESTDLQGNPVGVEGCGALAFEPTIAATATTGQAEAPSGLEFDLHQTQHESYEELATANLKDATVTLPEGMVLDPSAANGREACSSKQLGVATAVGQTPVRYLEEPAHCPPASKLGTAEVVTPLLGHPLKGAIYLAKPFDNPFGSLLGIYIVIEDEETGIIAKLAGHVVANSVTGQLTTTFEESPELPLEDVKLDFFKGSRAALVTPLTCGSKETTSTLTPWSTPEGADAHPSASFQVTAGCYASEAAAPKAASFSAGTTSPTAGAYSPFVLRVARNDGTQHLTGIEANLPEGLLGKIAGIPYCPESAIAQARSREVSEMGKQEIASPSCPAASEVGVAHVTAGAGEDPIPVSGHAYLAGPYKGAPFSLVVIVPAVAGPFDLGTVVDRIALNINEYTARVRSVADPLPTMRDGIPLDVRSIEVDVNRPGFTVNPTSCEPMAVEGSITTEPGQTAPLANRFQVGGCESLQFKPKFTASINAKHNKHSGESLHVGLDLGSGEANVAKVHVTLPKKLPARLNTLKHACTEAQFAEDPAGCPAEAVVGTAVAHTPLLPVPLEGPAMFVSHGSAAFPNLDLVLQGDGVHVTLVGDTYINPKSNITTSTFKTVPDVPVSSFELSLPAGSNSALGGNGNMCNKPLYMPTVLRGHNGAVLDQRTKIKVKGCKPQMRVVGHEVHRSSARIRVRVPSAGKLIAAGHGIKRVVKHVRKGKVVTITVPLSARYRHAAARRKLKIRVKVKLTFKPRHGKALHAHTRVLMR